MTQATFIIFLKLVWNFGFLVLFWADKASEQAHNRLINSLILVIEVNMSKFSYILESVFTVPFIALFSFFFHFSRTVVEFTFFTNTIVYAEF